MADEAKIRGQWKCSTKIVDTYTDPCIPAADAKVAAVLCCGGPCKYILKHGCVISRDWILEYTVPKIALCFPHVVALVLGKALIWAVFDVLSNTYLPGELCLCVWMAYEHITANMTTESS